MTEPEEPQGRVRHALAKGTRTFYELVEGVGKARSVVLVVGAGASMESGLPDWRQLVSRLLQRTTVETEGQAESLIDSYGLIACATIARGDLGYDDWISEVRRGLYSSDATIVREPGQLTLAISRLAISIPHCTIFTTNFDDLLRRAVTIARREANRSGQLSYDPEIVHLHGFVPQRGKPSKNLALDEAGYSELSQTAATQLYQSLQRSTAIFVGMSLNDSDIVQAIYQSRTRGKAKSGKGPQRYGIFRRPTYEEENNRLLALKRLRSLGVTPHEVNSFEQVTQVLVELYLRRLAGPHYWDDESPDVQTVRFGQRISYWQDLIEPAFPLRLSRKELDAYNLDEVGVLSSAELDDYRQAVVHRFLRRLVYDLPRKAMWHLEQGEEHAAILFVRKQTEEDGAVLEMWGSSWAFYPERAGCGGRFSSIVDRREEFIAVHAANAGTTIVRQKDETSRWSTRVAVPIILDESPWHRLLVGVVIFQTSVEWSQELRAQRHQDLVDILFEVGVELLDPVTRASGIALPVALHD